jgi:hypothetical protein
MNKYEIIINEKYLYIKNYIKIINISYSKITIEIDKATIFISGSNLIISKMDKYDILINGNVKGINFNYEK